MGYPGQKQCQSMVSLVYMENREAMPGTRYMRSMVIIIPQIGLAEYTTLWVLTLTVLSYLTDIKIK